MLTGRTIRTSFVILAASVVAAIQTTPQAQAHSSSCTPGHLVSALKQVEAECGAAKIVSAHRPGARIRGTGHVSQHSFCDGQRGAIDAVFKNRACALTALRKTNYTILTYGWSKHIHIGTDGWRGDGGARVAQRNAARARLASRKRASVRTASRGRRGAVRVAHRHGSDGWGNSNWGNSNWASDAGWSGQPSSTRGASRRSSQSNWSSQW
jgi:hypothetical protein